MNGRRADRLKGGTGSPVPPLYKLVYGLARRSFISGADRVRGYNLLADARNRFDAAK